MQRSLYKRVVGGGYSISRNKRCEMKRRSIVNGFFRSIEEHHSALILFAKDENLKIFGYKHF